jgi:hypothetical protein
MFSPSSSGFGKSPLRSDDDYSFASNRPGLIPTGKRRKSKGSDSDFESELR